MRFEHAHACAKGVVETIPAGLDPKHAPDDRQVKKENDVRNTDVRKCDRNNGGAARDRPVGRDV